MPVELRVRERHSANRLAQHRWRRRLAIPAKVEARGRTDVRVSPAVQDHAGDVRARIEARAAEEPNELLPYPELVVAVARPEHLRPRRRGLLPDRAAGALGRNIER